MTSAFVETFPVSRCSNCKKSIAILGIPRPNLWLHGFPLREEWNYDLYTVSENSWHFIQTVRILQFSNLYYRATLFLGYLKMLFQLHRLCNMRRMQRWTLWNTLKLQRPFYATSWSIRQQSNQGNKGIQ